MCCACRGRPPLRWRVAALGQPRPCGSGGVGRDALSGCARAFHGLAAQERQRQQFAGGPGPCRRRRRHRGGPAPRLQRCLQGWPACRASICTPSALPATAPGLAGAPGPQWCRAAGSTGGLHRPGASKSLLYRASRNAREQGRRQGALERRGDGRAAARGAQRACRGLWQPDGTARPACRCRKAAASRASPHGRCCRCCALQVSALSARPLPSALHSTAEE